MRTTLFAAVTAAAMAAGCAAGDLMQAPGVGTDGEGEILAALAPSTLAGARIRTTGTANIRSSSTVNSPMTGTQPANARGTVVGGPVVDTRGDGLKRWKIDFDTGPDGWAADPYIANLPSVASIVMTPVTSALMPGTTLQLTATLKDSAGNTLIGYPVTWASSDAQIATVSAAGLVTSANAGGATITATSGAASGSAAITAPAGLRFTLGQRVYVTPEPANIRAASSVTATLLGQQAIGTLGTVTGGPFNDVNGDRLTRWSVDFDGGVDGWAAEGYLAPVPVVTQVVMTPRADTLIIGQSATLTAVARDSAGTTVSVVPMTWTSRDTTIAKVAASGAVAAVAAGVTWIIASNGGRSDSAEVLVIPVPVASVSVSPASGSLTTPGTLQLSATTRDSAGNVLTGRSIAWTSATPGVAAVSSSGVVSGLAAGVATIVATSNGRSDSASITVSVPPTIHAGYYAAPNGVATADGSYTRPWDLRTALAGGGGRVQPGDTIWLRGGTYTGTYRSTVAGAAGRPVVVRGYPGERAIIDANTSASSPSVFYVGGAHTVFWDFEITNSSPIRSSTSPSNNARPNVIVNYASHTRYVNLVVRDGGVGFYNEPQYFDVEVIGSIFYNNGWTGPDRGHGHGLYLKSTTGPLVARDNVIFNQYGYGVHGYTNAGSGKLIGITLEGNVAFNNGIQGGGGSANILLGGADYADRDVVRDNFTWFNPGAGGTNVKIGYGSLVNGSVTVAGNYFAGGSTVFELGFWASPTVGGNTFIGGGTLARLLDPLAPLSLLNGNTQLNGTPAATRVIVRPSTWDAGRAMVIVYNWGGQGSVTADLSGVLSGADQYEVRSVHDLYGTAVASGSGSTVTIPMRALPAPAPVGDVARVGSTNGAFDVFIVRKTAL